MDTFITGIVNALPEAIVTAIITGTFVFLIQKRIENTYNEKLENFKAELQSSYFEHQTKFVRNHQKQVETLETLYQKFVTFANDFSDDMLECLEFELPSKKITKKFDISKFDNFRLEKHSDDLEECHRYLISNRLFLSADVRNEIDTTIKEAYLHLTIIPVALATIKYKIDADSIKSLNHLIKMTDTGITTLNLKKPNFELLLHQVVQQITLHQKTLENTYKSVAGIQTK